MQWGQEDCNYGPTPTRTLQQGFTTLADTDPKALGTRISFFLHRMKNVLRRKTKLP
jgi:hypothetical protein